MANQSSAKNLRCLAILQYNRSVKNSSDTPAKIQTDVLVVGPRSSSWNRFCEKPGIPVKFRTSLRSLSLSAYVVLGMDVFIAMRVAAFSQRGAVDMVYRTD